MSRHIVVAVPAYAGTVHVLTLRSLLHDLLELVKRGDRFSLLDDCGSAIICDARAELCTRFLALEDATDLVLIDHDVYWEAGALLRLVDYPVDLVAGVYPHRRDPVSYPVRWKDSGELWADPKTGLLEVAGAPGGFMRVSRKALLAMTEKHRELEFVSLKYGSVIGLFEPYRMGNAKLSEDYSFCQRWRDLGGKVWIDPMLKMGHIGNKSFVGCIGEWLKNRPDA